jgi:anti-sigma regulatory factor (Ser/Thr protein kinase)
MSEGKCAARSGEFEPHKLTFNVDEAVRSDVGTIDSEVSRIMALIKHAAHWDDLEGIQLALQEALANAVIHGNGCGSAETVRICIAVQEDHGILVVVKDSGSGFDPSAIPDPLAEQNLLASHGRGIFLIKQFMDDVWFEFENGTAVYMLKRRRT